MKRMKRFCRNTLKNAAQCAALCAVLFVGILLLVTPKEMAQQTGNAAWYLCYVPVVPLAIGAVIAAIEEMDKV